jgi:DNA invertase Pin-like site-specific DNA recombinase
MRAAIYARYSSENQSEKSLEDQIRVCQNYCRHNDILVDDRNIFTDQAVSGALINRPALQALEKGMENKEFEAIVVDDLSRLSRSNHQMLTLVLKFNYHQVKLISVSDGIVTDDENSKLGIQIRGLINELYLDDLRKKTMRGLEGQKLRGFSAGENVYGYYTKPHGELKLNKKGQAKYDGKIHVINPEESEIIKRIYKDFIGGKSISQIVIDLNSEGVATKKGRKAGWSTSTLSRILKNEKYIGTWDWRKYKVTRDPMTGRKKNILRPEKERLPFYREDLIILDQDTWNKTQVRWKELQGTWPVSKNKKGFYQQKSYIHTSPTHLFSGLMKCSLCNGAIVLMSGKSEGYYGCYNSKRKTCHNTLLVPRRRLETKITQEVLSQILTPDNLQYIFINIEKLAAETLNKTPEILKKRKAEIEKLKDEIQNYLNFVKVGNFSKAVADALSGAETKSDELNREVASLEFQQNNNFKAPPKEWIECRLEAFRETLNKNTVVSSMALKELLGSIALEPVLSKEGDYYHLFEGHEKDFKPYYVAHTNIKTLALLDDEHKGSNWYQWRRGRDSNPRIQLPGSTA